MVLNIYIEKSKVLVVSKDKRMDGEELRVEEEEMQEVDKFKFGSKYKYREGRYGALSRA